MEVGQELVSKSLNEVPGFTAVFAPPQSLSFKSRPISLPGAGAAGRSRFPPTAPGPLLSRRALAEPKCLKPPQKERFSGGPEPAGVGVGILEHLWVRLSPGMLHQPRGSGEHSLWIGHPSVLPDTALGGFSPNTDAFWGPKLPEMAEDRGRGERCSRSISGRGTRGIKTAKAPGNAAK